MCVCFWPVCQEIEQKDNNYFFIKRKIKNQPHQKTNQTWNIPLCFLSLPCRKGSSTNSFDLGDVNLYKVKILKYFFLVLGFYQEKYVYIIGMLTVPIWTYSGFGKKWLVYFVDSCFEFAAISCSSHCLPAVLPLEFCYILGNGFGESVQKMLALRAAEYFQESGKMPALISGLFFFFGTDFHMTLLVLPWSLLESRNLS